VRLYEIIIRPISGLGTPLKGDTLFGHFCWQAAYDPSLLNDSLDQQISVYHEKPFAVFSSAIIRLPSSPPSYILKRPDMPFSRLFKIDNQDRAEKFKEIKEKKKNKWMVLSNTMVINLSTITFITDDEFFQRASELTSVKAPRAGRKPGKLRQLIVSSSQPHNTINRLTGTTGTGLFAPYIQEYIHYFPEIEMSVFVLLDESATDIERIHSSLMRIGKWGYGKDASIGMGRFEVMKFNELPPMRTDNADACYALAPSVVEKNLYSKLWFMPFVRYGKHGDRLVCGRNPFKNPVVMADEGAVFKFKDNNILNKPYLGRAVSDVSLSLKETVVQGYAPYLPMKWE
jgi:CRISPR-associated protein Csm4